LTYKPTDVCESGGTIVLRSSNIKNGKIDLNDIVRVKCEISEKLIVKKNDILICSRNGSKRLVGKSAIIYDLPEEMTFGAFMAICKSPLFEYLYLYMQSELFFNQLGIVSSTTTINQLTQDRLNSFFIPIPPYEEQKRIIEKIKEIQEIAGQ
jgi:type I restriction enzyme S subunit